MYKTTFNANEKLWSGRSLPIVYNQNISIGHALLRAMKTCPHKIAQINANNDIQLTFAEIHIKTVRAAQNIQNLGFTKGDVFAIISRNNEHIAPISMALLCSGYPISGLEPSLGETELIQMLEITRPKLVFSDLGSYAKIKKCLEKSGENAMIYTFCGQVEDSLNVEDLFAATGIEEEFVPAELDTENDVAMIVPSSGSTGIPKAISLQHAMLWDCAERFVEPVYRESHNLLYFSHMGVGSGIILLLIGTIYNMTRVITTDDFSPELLLRIIEKYRISFICIWPLQLVSALKCEDVGKRDLSSLQYARTGATRVPPHLHNDLSRLIPNCRMIIGYGMTELGSLAHNCPHTGVNTVGQLNHGVTVKISDGNGVRLGIGEIGEISVRKMVTCNGYYRNQVKTNKLFDAEGFMRTSDVGYFDDNGNLFVIDRKEFYLTYCSDPISPLDVEEYLMSCPNIELAFVFKIRDKTFAALIKRNRNYQTTEQDILDLVLRKFDGKQHLNGGVHFIDSAFYAAGGKQRRKAIQSMAEDLYNAIEKHRGRFTYY